ncbi:hypothetical protein ACSBR1_018691 [Camellia fascicularis]
MHFTNKYVMTQVIHSPTATVASAASSQEKGLRPSMESTRDRRHCCCKDRENSRGALAA